MLGRRRRRRANIKTTLGKCLVFAGSVSLSNELFNYHSIAGRQHGGHGWLAKKDGSMMVVSCLNTQNQTELSSDSQ